MAPAYGGTADHYATSSQLRAYDWYGPQQPPELYSPPYHVAYPTLVQRSAPTSNTWTDSSKSWQFDTYMDLQFGASGGGLLQDIFNDYANGFDPTWYWVGEVTNGGTNYNTGVRSTATLWSDRLQLDGVLTMRTPAIVLGVIWLLSGCRNTASDATAPKSDLEGTTPRSEIDSGSVDAGSVDGGIVDGAVVRLDRLGPPCHMECVLGPGCTDTCPDASACILFRMIPDSGARCVDRQYSPCGDIVVSCPSHTECMKLLNNTVSCGGPVAE